jgi:hypothetical protein
MDRLRLFEFLNWLLISGFMTILGMLMKKNELHALVQNRIRRNNVPDVLFRQEMQPLLSSCSECHAPLVNAQKALQELQETFLPKARIITNMSENYKQVWKRQYLTGAILSTIYHTYVASPSRLSPTTAEYSFRVSSAKLHFMP